MADAAPFHEDIAGGPEHARADWLTTGDGLRLRAVHWPAGPGTADHGGGTVLLFPGRTEYAEKYALLAQDFADWGFDTLVVDWRGQGLSDRLLTDPLSGHVNSFGDYQQDVAAMVAHATALSLPRPWVLVAHSMGGAIGLRALIRGLPVERAVFSSPMWGISLSAALRPAAWTLSYAARTFGFQDRYAPGTSKGAYQNAAPFEGNLLTHDSDQYARMARQTQAHPELALAGPSLGWLNEALVECRRLAALPSPATPCLTFVGTNELIVDTGRIERRMARWRNGTLIKVEGGRHECLMETPARRGPVLARMRDHIAARTTAGTG